MSAERRPSAGTNTQEQIPETGSPAKKLFIKTYGCQMNVYDSQRMADALTADGYELTGSAEGADLVILNTCHIREKAAEKIYSELGRLKPLAEAKKQAGGKMTVGVAGCVAQAEGGEILRRQPMVDLVVGPQSYHRLPHMAREAQNGASAVETDFPLEDKFDHLPQKRRVSGPTSFLTVQEGCDKFCAFCVVPYTRGAETSRPVARVVEEAERLAAQGVVEVSLLGQNVNAYHGVEADGREIGLGALLRRLSQIEGVRRLRYTTSHPNDMDDELISAHAEVSEVMPYLHLPVQAGSDRVLRAMNRRHSAESYIRLIEKIRSVRPDIALSGDFIVGHPGETEEDFQQTLALVQEVGYAQAYSFKYSPRPGTPAAEREQVAEDEKAERLTRLQELLNAQQMTFQQACVGRILPVLLEKPGRKPNQLVGRSPYLQAVHVEADASLSGTIVDVAIEAAGPNSLAGRLIETTA